MQKVTKLSDGVELTAGRAKVRITAFNDAVVRVRVAPQGNFPKDFSWAVIQASQPSSVQIEESTTGVRMVSGRITVNVTKSPLLISFADANGRVLLADEPTLPMAWNGQRVRVWKTMPAGRELTTAWATRPARMNRRNRAFIELEHRRVWLGGIHDPMYKTIPFFIGLRKGTAYGVFFDNTYRSSFDFGKESPDYFSFGAEGGELNYYFLRRARAKEASSQAYHGADRTRAAAAVVDAWISAVPVTRYYPEARVREIAQLLREKKIPADVTLSRHRLSAGQRAVHGQSRRFSAFRADDRRSARAGHFA